MFTEIQMAEKSIKKLRKEIYSNPPKHYFSRNKRDVFYMNDIWSSDILGLKDYGLENKRNYRYVLVIIDNFSKYG